MVDCRMTLKLTSFSGSQHGSLFYGWYESRKYPVFFRALDGFYAPELFAQLPQLLQSHLYVVTNNEKPIGSVIVHDWNRTARSCSVGIMLEEESQCMRVCEPVMLQIARILFEDKALQKVKVNFIKEDEKILHLVEKYGFKKEGEYERECFIGGKYRTTVSYSFFSEQWEALCQRM